MVFRPSIVYSCPVFTPLWASTPHLSPVHNFSVVFLQAPCYIISMSDETIGYHLRTPSLFAKFFHLSHHVISYQLYHTNIYGLVVFPTIFVKHPSLNGWGNHRRLDIHKVYAPSLDDRSFQSSSKTILFYKVFASFLLKS